MMKCKNCGKERLIAESFAYRQWSVNSCGLLDDKMMDKNTIVFQCGIRANFKE